MLLTLVALGAGPASYLDRDVGLTVRVLLAPVFGMCVGASVFTTLVWWYPASSTYWLVPVAAVTSSGFALERWRRSRHTPRGRGLVTSRTLVTCAQVLVVCLAVLGPVDYSLSSHESSGPVVYKIADLDGWVMQTDGMERRSMLAAQDLGDRPQTDLVLRFWSGDAQKYNWAPELSDLQASLNHVLGLGAVDTEDSYLAVYMLVGAGGAFAAVRYALRRPTWGATLAGSLLGGTLFLQLFYDGVEPAIGAIAVLMGLVIVGAETLRAGRMADVVLLGLLLAGAAATLPPLLGPVAVVILGATVVRVLRGRASMDLTAVRRGGFKLTALVLIPFVLGPVGSVKAVMALVGVGKLVGELPNYHLDWWTIPQWLAQTRSLYDLGSYWSLPAELILGVAVPVVVVAACAYVVRCRLVSTVVAPVVAASAVTAVFSDLTLDNSGSSCSYCLDRGLDPAAGMLPIWVGIAVAVLAASRYRYVRWSALAVVVAVVPAVGYSSYREWNRFDRGSYFVDSTVRSVVSRIPPGGCTVMEGFNEGVPAPPAEEVLVYALADELHPGRLSLLTDHDDNGGLKYFALNGSQPVDSSEFCSSYSTVLTRVDSVATQRRTVFSAGDVALESRARPLDVVLDYGILIFSSDRSRQPADYIANSVQDSLVEPVQFVITGTDTGSAHVEAVVQLLVTGATATVTSPDPVSMSRSGATLRICMGVTGRPPARTAEMSLRSSSAALLASMTASPGPCPTR